jgi:hypothetical protein
MEERAKGRGNSGLTSLDIHSFTFGIFKNPVRFHDEATTSGSSNDTASECGIDAGADQHRA